MMELNSKEWLKTFLDRGEEKGVLLVKGKTAPEPRGRKQRRNSRVRIEQSSPPETARGMEEPLKGFMQGQGQRAERV